MHRYQKGITKASGKDSLPQNSFKKCLPYILVIFFIGFILIKNKLYDELEGCYGMPDGLARFFFLYPIGIFTFFLALIKLEESADSNFTRKIITLFFIICLPLFIVIQTIFGIKWINAPVIFKAQNHNEEIELVLRENNTYTLKISYPEWSCYHSGTFILESNMLELLGTREGDFEILFSSAYLKSNKELVPLDSTASVLEIK